MIKEFLGIGGYTREAEGYMSPEHLLFVTVLNALMIVLAVFLGRKNRGRDEKAKNRVLAICAVAINAFEIFKIVVICIRSADPFNWLYMLPLFLCSIQLIAIPLAAFSKGRLREAALDFVSIFGLLGAIMGTYAAGNNYASYPVISLDNVVSGITHTMAGFASLYIMIAGMASMKKRNIPITFAILFGFCTAAYAANVLLDYNYKFLMRGDGTPYDILYNLFSGNAVLYPLAVVVLFLLYICAFYGVFYLASKKAGKEKEKTVAIEKDGQLVER